MISVEVRFADITYPLLISFRNASGYKDPAGLGAQDALKEDNH